MTPKHLTNCPSCGQSPTWEYNKRQTFNADYATKSAYFASRLSAGVYTWSEDKTEFGYDTFTCGDCGSTVADVGSADVGA